MPTGPRAGTAATSKVGGLTRGRPEASSTVTVPVTLCPVEMPSKSSWSSPPFVLLGSVTLIPRAQSA